jgi:hypothetical protein
VEFARGECEYSSAEVLPLNGPFSPGRLAGLNLQEREKGNEV